MAPPHMYMENASNLDSESDSDSNSSVNLATRNKPYFFGSEVKPKGRRPSTDKRPSTQTSVFGGAPMQNNGAFSFGKLEPNKTRNLSTKTSLLGGAPMQNKGAFSFGKPEKVNLEMVDMIFIEELICSWLKQEDSPVAEAVRSFVAGL